jgi:hypothetical protein
MKLQPITMSKNNISVALDSDLSKLKPCFIITPIGKLNSEENIKAKGLIDSVIRPELEKYGFYALPAYDIKNSGDINNQVIQNILENELVIANLTGLNPNVMYELAVRHAVRKKVIMMTETQTSLPFDIHNQRTIFYDDSFAGSLQARNDLDEAIFAALNDQSIDNPIYKATELKSIINEDANKPDRDLFTLLFERLDNIESAVSKFDFKVPVNSLKTDLGIYTHLTITYIGVNKSSKDVDLTIRNMAVKSGLILGLAKSSDNIKISFTAMVSGERSDTDKFIQDLTDSEFNIQIHRYATK